MMKKTLIFILCLLIVLWFCGPVLLILIAALTPSAEYYDLARLVPTKLTLTHLESLFVRLKATLISIQTALLSIVISFAIGLPAAYVLTRYVFKGKNLFRLTILLTRSFPVIIIGVPLVTLYLRIGIADSVLGVSLAHSSMILPFIIIISSSILGGISVEYEEAGMVFGLTRFRSFLRITLPLALPGFAAAAIYAFVLSWNEVFISAIINLTNRTLPAHILNTAMTSPDYFKFAAGTVMALPAMIFIFFTRKYLMSMWGISLK